MKLFQKIFFLVFILISNKIFAKDSHRVSIGLGQFNFMEDGTEPHKDQSQMMNF